MQGCAASYSNATWCKQTFDGSCTVLDTLDQPYLSPTTNTLALPCLERINASSIVLSIDQPIQQFPCTVVRLPLQQLTSLNSLYMMKALRIQFAAPTPLVNQARFP